MSGVRLIVDDVGIDEGRYRLSKLTNFDDGPFLDAMGALVVSQTQNRIASEKTAPDGTPWKDNSEGSDILVKSGGLLDSIDHTVKGDSVEVGSSKEYAAVHQFGAIIVPVEAKNLVFTIGGTLIFAKKVTIPARPWLGLSAQNRLDLRDLANDMLLDLMQ